MNNTTRGLFNTICAFNLKTLKQALVSDDKMADEDFSVMHMAKGIGAIDLLSPSNHNIYD